jgi:hypothetical protein
VKALGLACATLMIVACEGGGGPRTNFGVMVPTPPDGSNASLTFVEPVILSTRCVDHVLTSEILLVISTGPSTSSLDSVTLRLNDGSLLGGPSVTFPQPDLQRMFGTTVVFGTRTLTFRPGFVCDPSTAPVRSIGATVQMVDRANGRSVVTATAAVQ